MLSKVLKQEKSSERVLELDWEVMYRRGAGEKGEGGEQATSSGL